MHIGRPINLQDSSGLRDVFGNNDETVLVHRDVIASCVESPPKLF
jgi:hypothetical protein